MADYIVGMLVGIAVTRAIAAIIKARKNGRKCMGCSDSGNCNGHCNS